MSLFILSQHPGAFFFGGDPSAEKIEWLLEKIAEHAAAKLRACASSR